MLMLHTTRRIALKLVVNTPLEPVARNIYGKVIPQKGNIYDQQTFKLMKQVLSADSSCIDVGAYRGEIVQQMIKYAPKGQHFAFEPVPENYEYVNRRFNSVTTFNMALSDKPSTATFQHVVGRPARSGLREVEYPDKNQRIEKFEVVVETLDRVIPKNAKIDLIKIDVEGAELGVLKGAKKLIKTQRPFIVFEHELEKAVHYGTKPEEVYDFLHDCGLKINLMENLLAGKPALTKKTFVETVKTNSEFYFVAYAG